MSNAAHRLFAAKLLLAACLGALAPASMAEGSADSAVNSQPQTSTDCNCNNAYRRESLKPTPTAKAIFAAARAGDEAKFTELLNQTPDINSYLVDDKTLLMALLWPRPPATAAEKNWDNVPEMRKKLFDERRAEWPARARMLALALDRGANPNEVTFSAGHLPLELAMLFGSPEMVRLLLKAGADPNGLKGSDWTALDAVLMGGDSAVKHSALPNLVSRDERTEMFIDVLRAGAKRPYMRFDTKGDPPAADQLLWPKLIGMTNGTTVLDAFIQTGTRPRPPDIEDNLIADAAYAGDADTVAWLQAQLPRYYDMSGFHETHLDAWTDAAISALGIKDKALRAKLFNMLTSSDTDPYRQAYYGRREYGSSLHTSLLASVVAAGDMDLLRQTIAMGAKTGSAKTGDDARLQSASESLITALRMRRLDLIETLLAVGASPMYPVTMGYKFTPLSYSVDNALYTYGTEQSLNATEDGRKFRYASAEMLLRALAPEQVRAANTPESTPMRKVIHAGDPALLDLFVKAGFSLGVLSLSDLFDALPKEPTGSFDIANAMLDAGVGSDGKDVDDHLVYAIGKVALLGNAALLDRLLALRPNNSKLNDDERKQLAGLIFDGQINALELLRARGWQMDHEVSQRAVDSMKPEIISYMLKVTGSPIESFCITPYQDFTRQYTGYDSAADAIRARQPERWQQLVALGIDRLKPCTKENPMNWSAVNRGDTGRIFADARVARKLFSVTSRNDN